MLFKLFKTKIIKISLNPGDFYVFLFLAIKTESRSQINRSDLIVVLDIVPVAVHQNHNPSHRHPIIGKLLSHHNHHSKLSESPTNLEQIDDPVEWVHYNVGRDDDAHDQVYQEEV